MRLYGRQDVAVTVFHSSWLLAVCERWPFIVQKATFCKLICHLLQAKRRHIAKLLTIKVLQTDVKRRPQVRHRAGN